MITILFCGRKISALKTYSWSNNLKYHKYYLTYTFFLVEWVVFNYDKIMVVNGPEKFNDINKVSKFFP